MARPAGSPTTFATDANYTNSTGRDWQGTPTKVEPSSGEKGQGFTPGRKIVAQWLNFLLGGWAAWLTYFATIIDSSDEHVYQTPKARIVTVPGTALQSGRHKLDGSSPAAWTTATLDEGWRADSDRSLAGAGPGGRDLIGPLPWAICTGKSVVGYYPISPYIETGKVFTEIRIICKPGTAHATALDRMQFRLLSIDPQGTAVSALESATDDGTALAQTVIITVDPTITANRATRSYVLAVISSADPGTEDLVYGFEIRFNDPGPRNG